VKTRIVEATNRCEGDPTGVNYGKFLVGSFDEAEWSHRRQMGGTPGWPLLFALGHSPGDVLVLDLQTCEGAVFTPGGLPAADLEKHKVWVCPLFEPFLCWLYGYLRECGSIDALPGVVELPDAHGYRRPGGSEDGRQARR
jgi:hypothetical protein